MAAQVDVLQIGARNMQNFDLLKAVGRSGRPVLLKRGMSATIDELLAAAEYILAEGNPNVILCERGIRTFENATRNTLDLSAVPVLRERRICRSCVDPSHGVGVRRWIAPLCRAAKAVGAHGLLIEVHPNPPEAKSDKDQALTFEDFADDHVGAGNHPRLLTSGPGERGSTHMNATTMRGVRGAVTVAADERGGDSRTRRATLLLTESSRATKSPLRTSRRCSSALTPDVRAVFPALAARGNGLDPRADAPCCRGRRARRCSRASGC